MDYITEFFETYVTENSDPEPESTVQDIDTSIIEEFNMSEVLGS